MAITALLLSSGLSLNALPAEELKTTKIQGSGGIVILPPKKENLQGSGGIVILPPKKEN
ncbi:hypothetical protein [Pseudoalteromonas sp. 68 DY56-GL68]|uniref:hypothetical protein n=1 Tax=Pseudoalteromonas sp. 68 DY56-GL68 TaxID=2974919 RepID=UPI00352A017F